MKNDRLVPGLILVLIGVTFLLRTFGIVHFDWGNIFHLWPIFIIIAGVNLAFANNRSPLATTAKVGVVVLGFALLLFGRFGDGYGFPVYYSNDDSHSKHDKNNSDQDDDDDDDDNDQPDSVGVIRKISGKSIFNEPFTADTKIAQLNISGAATSYELSDTTNQLFRAETSDQFGQYDISHHTDGSTTVLDFAMAEKKGHFKFDIGRDGKNTATFKLNPLPLWDINVETGATALNFDLTKFKIRTLKLNGGAASFNVKLGQPQSTTSVEVSTGMASVNISIPQNAACRIITDSGLSSTNFDGFTKTSDGNYQTANFDSATNKIFINIDGGMSDFNVKRY